MESIRQIYRIGMGPSSSHTMGPRRAAELFARRHAGQAVRVEVHLFASLAATGRGHLTDRAIAAGLGALPVEIFWHADQSLPGHPNAMRFDGFDAAGQAVERWQVYSVGGGALADDRGPLLPADCVRYPHDTLAEVLDWCEANDQPICGYAFRHEPDDLTGYLSEAWSAMGESIARGLAHPGELLPGPLGLRRKAADVLAAAHERVGFQRDLNLLSAYALAVAEENAAGGRIVTAPTCGSAGVLPAVLHYFDRHYKLGRRRVLDAMATAAVFGSSVAARSSISGAKVGCQGEIGVAAAMAAAAAAQLMGASPRQVEYAAEMGLEHSLGLTCDPIAGLVQAPCIERNAFAAMRAVDCAAYAIAAGDRHLVSFDNVVEVMDVTGRDMQAKYRETATGGLAEIMRSRLGLA